MIGMGGGEERIMRIEHNRRRDGPIALVHFFKKIVSEVSVCLRGVFGRRDGW